jgi:hypothetical protein
MAYVIVHFLPCGMNEQYEASIAAVPPIGDTLLTGHIFHAAGASPGG